MNRASGRVRNEKRDSVAVMAAVMPPDVAPTAAAEAGRIRNMKTMAAHSTRCGRGWAERQGLGWAPRRA